MLPALGQCISTRGLSLSQRFEVLNIVSREVTPLVPVSREIQITLHYLQHSTPRVKLLARVVHSCESLEFELVIHMYIVLYSCIPRMHATVFIFSSLLIVGAASILGWHLLEGGICYTYMYLTSCSSIAIYHSFTFKALSHLYQDSVVPRLQLTCSAIHVV